MALFASRAADDPHSSRGAPYSGRYVAHENGPDCRGLRRAEPLALVRQAVKT